MQALFRILNDSDAQPVRMQTAANKVELALMHVMEADPSFADWGAMCNRNPLHTFMFDSHGKLLNANRAAFEAFQSEPPSEFYASCVAANS